MYHIIYMSSSYWQLRIGELLDILVKSRERNLEEGITGLLFYRDGNFLGCLEGEEAGVKERYESVRRDRRQMEITTLFSEEIPRREFRDWSMAFRVRDIPMPRGFNPILNADGSEMDLSWLPMKVRAFTRIFSEFSGPKFRPSPSAFTASPRGVERETARV